MSLLNQVLQDLEKREANNPKLIQDPLLSKHIKVAAGQGLKHNKRLILIAIIFIISVTYRFYLFLPSQSTEVKPQAIIKQATLVKNSIPPVRSTKNEAARSVAPVVKKAPVQAIVVAKQVKKSVNKTIKPTISIEYKADYFYSKAKKNQDLLEQQALLNKALALDTQHLNAHLLLANNLLRQGLTDSAMVALQNSLNLFPKNMGLTNILAQLYLQSKQLKLALKTLLKINPANTQNETYLSLLAAAYQQDNDAKSSAVIYQKLLHINDNKAEYWLGLALAFEQLKRPHQAKIAYQQALNKSSLHANIVSYIKQRIAQLN